MASIMYDVATAIIQMCVLWVNLLHNVMVTYHICVHCGGLHSVGCVCGVQLVDMLTQLDGSIYGT